MVVVGCQGVKSLATVALWGLTYSNQQPKVCTGGAIGHIGQTHDDLDNLDHLPVDHLPVDNLGPNLPFWDASSQDLHSIDSTQETCGRSYGLNGLHTATSATDNDISGIYLPWNM